MSPWGSCHVSPRDGKERGHVDEGVHLVEDADIMRVGRKEWG